MNNFHIIVLDGVGVGEMPDAKNYSDEGSNTLGNMAERLGGLNLPNLEKLGVGNIIPIKGIIAQEKPLASYGKLAEMSPGKDSTTGHWELGGLKVEIEFPFYPNGFPEELINKFLAATGEKGVLGNYASSGTEIIKELGAEHVRTGFPIVYTSADSVFQIAAHEEVIPIPRLYEICSITREKVLVGKDACGRVIARPFIGTEGNYKRTTNRKDYSLDPPDPTILDYCLNNGIETYAIGKVNDLFNYKGIKHQLKTKSNDEGIDKIIETAKSVNGSFIFTNLVDFDVYYGHRNDPEGFHSALQEFDKRLPHILGALDESDRLVITADHGNDATDISTDHTREYIPLLYYRKNVPGKNLGIRKTFADIAQTAAHYFQINNDLKGTSFLNE
ncbi:MAG: phosphopentomutase [Ignavibacteriae bacterium HGW-Ignavibacteriae-3]|nr:MAG: phosphopentomutase [Ignavibacteriae bacterium HGW-Ignavibacteriae-3]